jgi:hypothetical protein
VIVGGLGVLDDVTVSQASLVFELSRANPAMRAAELVRAALRVGRDHVAATVNTIFLAYAGAALPLLVLFFVVQQPLGTVATSEVVAVEVVRSLCGSVGLIAAVPLTTLLAVALVRTDGAELAEAAVGGDGHVHGPLPSGGALPAAPAGPTGEPEGRVVYQVADDLGIDGSRAVWFVALEQLGPVLTHATVPAPDATLRASLGSLPHDVQQAVAEVTRLLGAEAEAGGWHRRGERDSLQLDLREPTHLELLRRYGPYAPGTKAFAGDQAAPLLGTIAHEGGGAPRVVLRLDPGERERTRLALARLGITAPLVPRRARSRQR